MVKIKSMSFAFVCLGVMAGLIECSPFSPISPLELVPEKVLVKPPHSEARHPEADFTQDILGLPSEVIRKFGGMIIEMIPDADGNDGHEKLIAEVEGLAEQLAHIEHLKGLQDPISAVQEFSSQKQFDVRAPIRQVSNLPTNIAPVSSLAETDSLIPTEDISKLIKNEEIAKTEEKLEAAVEAVEAAAAAETNSRKRRHVNGPSTIVLNSKPRIEDRFTIDSPPEEAGRFHHGSNGVVFSEHGGLDELNRPVIIYVSNCKNIKFDGNNDNDEEED